MPAAEQASIKHKATSGMTRAWKPFPNMMFSRLLRAVSMNMKSHEAIYPATSVISRVDPR